jgi:transposase
MLSIIVSPHRFRTRRQLWEYAGLGVVMSSSSEYVQSDDGRWTKAQVRQTRGLNRHHNHELESIFKGAATTVIGQARNGCPLYQHYASMLQDKIKPNLAKLTLARQIAAITLALWKTEARYDPAKRTKQS